MPNRINVQIIQPVVPSYREPLFKTLFEDDRFQVYIMAGQKEPYGVTSVKPFHQNIDLQHPIAVFAKVLMWQKDLMLLPHMGRGDILIINGNVKFLSNYPLILLARKKGIKVIWWGHAWSATSNKLSFFIRTLVMKIVADAFLVYTQTEKKLLLKYGFDESSIHYMNNTIYQKEIFRLKEEIPANQIVTFKSVHGLAEKKVLLFVGRLKGYPKTELDLAIRSLSLLNNDNNFYKLVVIGDGPDRRRLEVLADDIGQSRNVLFTGRIYEETELAPWFLSANCFVFPGPIGLSLLHAFSYGLPVVTHEDRANQMPEIAALIDGKNGALFRRGDIRDLAKQITLVVSESEKFRSGALETVKNDFSFDSMIDRIKKMLFEIGYQKMMRKKA